MEKVSRLSDKRGMMLIPIDSENGYLVDEHVLRLYTVSGNDIMSLGDGTPGSHHVFLKYLVRDYINLYRKLEKLDQLTI
jgi:hypothetical protein